MQHPVLKDLSLHGIDQGLELYATDAHPLRQGGAWDSHTGAPEDAGQAVLRQVVGVIGYQHLRQQAGGGNVFVNDLRSYGARTMVWH